MSNYDLKKQFIELAEIWASNYAKKQGIKEYSFFLRDLHYDEIEGFLNAIKQKILIVDEIGGCKLPKIHHADRKPTEPSSIFGKKQGNIIFITWREYLTQVGAVATLVSTYKWPIELVALDPRDWTFDVAGLKAITKNSFMIIAGESKKTKKELLTLLAQMSEASESKLSASMLKSSKVDGHKKYRGLLKERPLYFWAMAPGINRYYELAYESDNVLLKEIDDLPDYPTILKLL